VTALDTLRHRLLASSQQAFRGLALDQTPMEREVQRLTAWLKSGANAKPPRDLIREALARFHKEQKTDNFRDTRLVTYGFVDAFGEPKYRLIEDRQRFPKLLECVERYRPEARQFRRCYRGLLGGYFIYDPEADGHPVAGMQNWETLRTYLYDRAGDLQVPGTLPDWVPTVERHGNLLTSNPCGRYGQSFLEGNEDEFTQVQQALEIPDGSWVVSRLVLAQIDAATQMGDAKFKEYIPKLLNLVEAHPVLLNNGLARVLHRYQQGRNLGVSPELRDFSFGNWGNPWLARNSARWSLVPAATRDMVANWLKLELIHKFFNLLAEDGVNDSRRLVFWQRYYAHISEMYFALGRRASTDQSADFRKLRQDMLGLRLGLTAGGSPQNNAFIMRIGNYVVVEFGIRANACFIFKGDRLPFSLTGNVAGDRSELKSDSRVERLRHFDGHQRWEQTFEATLWRLMGVRPAKTEELPVGVGVPSGRVVPARAATRTNTGAIAGSRTPPPSSTVTRNAPPQIEIPVFVPPVPDFQKEFSRPSLNRFCSKHSLTIKDFSQSGGNLWVLAGNMTDVLNRQLVAWGFAYKPGKGWWRKEA